MTRTPFESQLDFQAAWAYHMTGNRRLTLMADFFNVFNNRQVLSYDQNTELSAGTPNPDFGKPVNTLLGGTPPQYNAPFSMRIGARFEF